MTVTSFPLREDEDSRSAVDHHRDDGPTPAAGARERHAGHLGCPSLLADFGNVRPQHDVGMEDTHECLEVSRSTRSRRRRRPPRADARGHARWAPGRALDPPPSSARELSGRGRGTPDHRRDLLERQVEHVVEHEHSESLCGVERIEHDEKREAHRVGEQRFLFGVGLTLTAHDRIRHTQPNQFFRACLSRLKGVEAHSRHDRRQPATKVLDPFGTRSAPDATRRPEPPSSASRRRAEHSVRDSAANGFGVPRNVGLASLCHPSCSRSVVASGHTADDRREPPR